MKIVEVTIFLPNGSELIRWVATETVKIREMPSGGVEVQNSTSKQLHRYVNLPYQIQCSYSEEN
mgnify:FL=1